MARFRISRLARDDLQRILTTSADRWGAAGRARYAALFAAAIRAIARAPEGSATRDRAELSAGVRSLHIRQVHAAHGVKEPVHVIFYRVDADVIEVVRVLHERMEPALHVSRRKRGRR